MEKVVGQRNNKIGTAVNAACEGNLSACHFGQTWDRFVSHALEVISSYDSLRKVHKNLLLLLLSSSNFSLFSFSWEIFASPGI
jgi:hypothetical protein